MPFMVSILNFQMSTFLPTPVTNPEPAVRKQGGDGDSQHAGEKHHTAEVWVSFHPAGPTPTRLQCHDEQQRPGWVSLSRCLTHVHSTTYPRFTLGNTWREEVCISEAVVIGGTLSREVPLTDIPENCGFCSWTLLFGRQLMT